MVLVFFNTLGRRKEEFREVEEGRVLLYTCGPTVYDFAHIGNFRTYVWQDLLKRWLLFRGYSVDHLMNITDVDDKTISGSRSAGVSLKEFTKRFEEAFLEDCRCLNILPATAYFRATEHVPAMVSLVESLLEKGFAYKSVDGVYFDISKFSGYGRLSGLDLSGLKAGARVKADSYSKEDAQDFALWKFWDELDGSVFWDASFGRGRPGWHIECSAMSLEYFGKTFDIHTGGVDLVFPHHENEIAQSEAATGRKFVNYWLHVEHLLVDGRKMSKSLGNFFTLRQVLERGYSARAVRFLFLSTHYRSQLNFTFSSLEAAENTVKRLFDFVKSLRDCRREEGGELVGSLIEEARVGFCSALDDDLNVGSAFACLFEFVSRVNELVSRERLSRSEAWKVIDFLLDLDRVLGLGLREALEEEEIPKEVIELVSAREQARKRGDYVEGDRLRKLVLEKGFVLEDTPSGTRVRKK